MEVEKAAGKKIRQPTETAKRPVSPFLRGLCGEVLLSEDFAATRTP
jgi:hypothetical protein